MGRRNIPDRLPQDGTAKGTYFATGMGNDKGSISFGHIHEKGDVTSGVMLRTPNGKHFASLDIDGQRKGWTTFAGPGNFSVEAGDDPPVRKKKKKDKKKYISLGRGARKSWMV